jgi:hypothetical protein
VNLANLLCRTLVAISNAGVSGVVRIPGQFGEAERCIHGDHLVVFKSLHRIGESRGDEPAPRTRQRGFPQYEPARLGADDSC